MFFDRCVISKALAMGLSFSLLAACMGGGSGGDSEGDGTSGGSNGSSEVEGYERLSQQVLDEEVSRIQSIQNSNPVQIFDDGIGNSNSEIDIGNVYGFTYSEPDENIRVEGAFGLIFGVDTREYGRTGRDFARTVFDKDDPNTFSPIVYVDRDGNESTGYPINGIGADIRILPFSFSPSDYDVESWNGAVWERAESPRGLTNARADAAEPRGGVHLVIGFGVNYSEIEGLEAVLSIERPVVTGNNVNVLDRTSSFVLPEL